MNGIPILDATRLDHSATLARLDRACREWGVFQVAWHDVDADLTAALQAQMRSFFALPPERKRAISRSAENPWGFFDRELTKNTRDWKEIFDYGPAAGGPLQPQWPEGLPHFARTVRAYHRACERLAFRLLAALSRNLGMPADHLAAAFRPAHSSFLRLNHYPVCPTPACPRDLRTPERGFLGVNHHTDAGALTLLLQDEVAGLEVYHDGRWHGIEPRVGTLVVNLGDITQVWSNDRYRAVLHRVRANPACERFSVPFFFNPAYESRCAPLPSTVDAHHPTRYRAIGWGEFRSLRAAGDYRDQGEEVQIHHYRV